MSFKFTLIAFIGFFSITGTLFGQSADTTGLSNSDLAPSLEMQLVPLEEIIRVAILYSPYLKYDSTLIRAKENDVKLQKRKWQNNLSAFANYSQGNQGFLLNGNTADVQNNLFSGYRYGVNFSLPLSELTTRKINLRKNKAELNAYKFKKDQTEMELRRQVIADYNNLITAQKILKIKTSAKENALVVQQMADKQFREGTTSLEEYATVSTMTVNAEADYEQVKNTFNSLYLQFEELVGVRLTTLMNKK